MKTNLKSICLAICVASVMALPSGAFAQEKKGAQLQKELVSMKTEADVEALETGDSFAMACAKCKTIWVAKVQKPRAGGRGATLLTNAGRQTQLVGKHACPGCKGTVTLNIASKGAKGARVIQHTCSSCGDESAYCCATKKSDGPTKGMEKKK